MGVRGLTALVEQIRGSISKTHVLPVQQPPVTQAEAASSSTASPAAAARRCVVVDFWAFVYWTADLLDARLGRQTWILGGCYREHEQLVKDIVALWLSAGLWPIFVADGPTPPVKLDTVANRLQRNTLKVVEFMRSSPSSNSRNSLAFQRNNRILPVFSYKAVLSAVESFDPTYFPIQMSSNFVAQIDRSKPALRFIAREADFETASLAMMFNGIVLSQDSDYFILCAQDKTCGYAPFDDLSFTLKQDAAAVAGDADDGFQAASNSKKRRGAPVAAAVQESSPYPPFDTSTVQAIRITVYSGSSLAAQLGIPPNLLTLLAALMGNDHVNFSALFFRNSRASVDSSTRLYHLAGVIKDCWTRFNIQAKKRSMKNLGSGTATPATSGTATPLAPSTPGRGGLRPITKPPSISSEVLMHELLDPAKSLVQRIVERLLEDSQVDWLSSTEVSEMADQLLSAMSAYTTSAQDHSLNVQERELARFLKGHYEGLIEQRHQDEPIQPLSPDRLETLDKYREAYLSGRLPTTTLGVMLYRRLMSFTLLEDVSQASVSHTYGQPLRLWFYAVLFSAFGLEWAQTPEDDIKDAERKAEAARRRAEREEYLDEVVSLHSESTGSDGEDDSYQNRHTSEDEEEEAIPRKPDPVVIEMLRRGDRASEVVIPIPSLAQLASDADLAMPIPSGCSFTPDQRTTLFLAAHDSDTAALRALPPALQTTVAVLRHIVKVTAERTASRTLWWKQHEVRGALLMALLLTNGKSSISEVARRAPAMPTNQIIHSAAVFQGTLDASTLLRQALLLDDDVKPQELFHGGLWHALVSSSEHQAAAAQEVDQNLLERLCGLVAGEEGYVYAGPSREDRKTRKKEAKEGQRQQHSGASTPTTAARFSLLDIS